MKTKKDRFDFEESLVELGNICEDIDTILYKYMDSPDPGSEDEIANMLIGIKALHLSRYEKMWALFEELVRDKTISGPEIEDCSKTPPAYYDECNNGDMYYK